MAFTLDNTEDMACQVAENFRKAWIKLIDLQSGFVAVRSELCR